MDTHGLRSMFNRRNVVPLTFLFLFIVVATFGLTTGVVQSSATAGGSDRGDQKPPFMPGGDIAKEFNDEDLKVKDDKPGGKWTYSTELDLSQKNDPAAPAYVSGIQLLSGAGKHAGINKIKRVQIKNKSPQTIVSVQVRFEVFNFDAPGKILLADTFPLVNISIAPDTYQVVEVRTLHPARMLKALAREGVLYGNYGIRIGVQGARFANGTFWSWPEPVALLGSPLLDQPPGSGFPALASLATHIPRPSRSPAIKQADMTPCTLKPSLAASAFL